MARVGPQRHRKKKATVFSWLVKKTCRDGRRSDSKSEVAGLHRTGGTAESNEKRQKKTV